MKIIMWIFWLASILSNGLASLSSLRESTDRELIYPIPELTTYASYNVSKDKTISHQNEFLAPQLYKHQREIQRDLESWKNQNTDFRKDRTYYGQKNAQSNNSASNRNENGPTTTIFRIYGRGKAQVMRQGQTVYVPNELGRNGYKVSLPRSGTVLANNENEIKAIRHERGCKECPKDQTVVATKGNIFAILPEPCEINPRMWVHHSGPRPGNKIPEGVHLIRGYLGPPKKFCQYHYQVLVRRCEVLKEDENTTIECSAENSWGSVCTAFCKYGKESSLTQLECRENLTWSNSVPKCKGQNNCSTFKLKTNSKVYCQTANMTQVKGDFIPNGSTCKFLQNEKEISINCKDGKWRIIRKSKSLLMKKQKQKIKNRPGRNDACNPNPCQNGGTCLKPESNKGPPICKCRSQTQGFYCEMRECYHNICENDGVCFLQNEERICYCTSNYSGDTCQYYTLQ